jgi:hypothetical protein
MVMIELYRVTDDLTLAPTLRATRASLRLGFFWLEYCAAAGLTPTGEQATCRHEEGFNDRGMYVHRIMIDMLQNKSSFDCLVLVGNASKGCWGAIVGRLVYDNTFYHRGGNYPRMYITIACHTF